MKNGFLIGCAILASGISSAAFAQDTSLNLSTGVSTGDYGSSRDTTMVNIAAGGRFSTDDFSVSVSIPYVIIDSPGVVFSGFDSTPLVMVPDLGGERFRREGIGDPTVTVAKDFGAGSFDLRATGRVKIPVQGYNDISTGEIDYSVSGEVSRSMGRFTPFASVGYRWFGDPDLWTIKDGFSASAGVAVPVGKGAAVVSYEFAETTSDFIYDSHEIVALYDAPITDNNLRLAAFGTVGLSSGARDFGAGLRLSLPF